MAFALSWIIRLAVRHALEDVEEGREDREGLRQEARCAATRALEEDS